VHSIFFMKKKKQIHKESVYSKLT